MKRLDLLSDRSPPRKYSRRQKEILTFCFARGESEEELLEACAPPLEESTFQTECFAADLFLDELLEATFPLVVSGKRMDLHLPHLKRTLLRPPSRASVRLRHSIFAELCARQETLTGLESAYLQLREFRRALAGADALGGKISHLRRRVEILGALRRCVEALEKLGTSSDSALRRAAKWAVEVKASIEFRRLETLLDFEDKRMVLETLLQVGYDGSLRRFEIVSAKRAPHPAFNSNRVSRFFRRLLSLLRGYRFSDEDLMSQLLDQVFSDLEEETVELLGCGLELEFYLASIGFRTFCKERGYPVCLPEFSDGSKGRRLEGLFNPWLVAQGVDAVPSAEAAIPPEATVIVTGPNSGGKTRLLQALAVSQLLGQVGSFVPAKRAELVWVEQLFLSLLEHVDAAQSEGRLGMELMRIRRVFETSGHSSLIIMDELCSGTNPSEGEQIFEMVLELFEELRPQVVISTHFLDFAARLEKQDRESLKFIQVEIGPRGVPTFQFVPGVAKTSLARNTAARLGVTREELLQLIELQSSRSRGEAEPTTPVASETTS